MSATPTSEDAEHLRLLAIFHYVVAGFAFLFSFLPLLYAAMGSFFVYAARHGTHQPGQEPPPAVVGWIFVGFGCAFFLLGLAIAICILFAGRALARRKHYGFALVVACVECLFLPFGTILGIFTLIVLSRPSAKALFFPAANEKTAEIKSA
jgi:hypothetical protein